MKKLVTPYPTHHITIDIVKTENTVVAVIIAAIRSASPRICFESIYAVEAHGRALYNIPIAFGISSIMNIFNITAVTIGRMNNFTTLVNNIL
jgi:hypothetical protein